MQRFAASVVGAVVVLGLVGDVTAHTPGEELREHVGRILAIIEDPDRTPAQAGADARRAIRTTFAFSDAARRALGQHWMGLSAAERRRFTELFGDFITDALMTQVRRASARHAGYLRLSYGDERVDGDRAAVPLIIRNGNTDMPVEARMLRRQGRWQIADVVVEGVSLVDNYRAQCDRVLGAASFPELIRRMEERRVVWMAATPAR